MEAFWALQLIGAIACVFNPSVPARTVAGRVERDPSSPGGHRRAGERNAASRREDDRDGDRREEDLALLQLTSGTSGAPRASMIRHRNVMAYMRTSSAAGQLAPDDIFVSWVPPWHDLGLIRFIIGPAYYGVSCHIVEAAVNTIPEWLQTISQVRGTLSAAPDFAFRLAVRMVNPETVDLTSLRFVTSGGEPVRWSSIQAFKTHLG